MRSGKKTHEFIILTLQGSDTVWKTLDCVLFAYLCCVKLVLLFKSFNIISLTEYRMYVIYKYLINTQNNTQNLALVMEELVAVFIFIHMHGYLETHGSTFKPCDERRYFFIFFFEIFFILILFLCFSAIIYISIESFRI